LGGRDLHFWQNVTPVPVQWLTVGAYSPEGGAPMKTLRSHVGGAWHQASDRFVPLFDPSSEEEIAQVSSDGIDFESAVAYSRSHGGASLMIFLSCRFSTVA